MRLLELRSCRVLAGAILTGTFLSHPLPACGAPAAPRAGGYRQAAALIDVRSTFSDGAYDIRTLAEMAEARGFEVLIINDHDNMVMEYGLPPFRNIFKKRVELNSVNRAGAGAYLDAIGEAQKKFPGLILVPGSESAPFYYWTGSYFTGDLTAHNHEKRLLTVGLSDHTDYESLPVMHNTARSGPLGFPTAGMLLFLCSLGISIFLIARGAHYRSPGALLLLIVLGMAYMAESDAFKSSPFDQYHGDRGIAPYQLLIDHVNSRAGLTFWNYPETLSGVRNMGPIRLDTPPYPEALEESGDYTGFAAIYGDNITLTEPGKAWDRVLAAYCLGERKRPVWAISTADYHNEKDGRLGDFPTVLLLKEKSREGVLRALKSGKMYACRDERGGSVRLDEFSVGSHTGGITGLSGDEIALEDDPRIRISLSGTAAPGATVKVRLIRSGELIRTFEGPLPMHIEFEDKYRPPGRKIYYRMDLRGRGQLVSNPIFVTFDK